MTGWTDEARRAALATRKSTHTVSQVTLGGKVKSTQSLAAWQASRGDPGTNKAAANVLGAGHPKAAPAPVHGGFKVQSLDTRLAGTPWKTEKRYGNKTVAERVAQHMRTDGGYTRVK